MMRSLATFIFFFFNDTATTEIYTLSLHDALPISIFFLTDADDLTPRLVQTVTQFNRGRSAIHAIELNPSHRSEEHTSELQSHLNLVCRLLLEKKKKNVK